MKNVIKIDDKIDDRRPGAADNCQIHKKREDFNERFTVGVVSGLGRNRRYYEIEMRKRKVVINRPFQVGIAVYQMSKLRILQFYYDCLDRYLDRRDFELMQMETDSLYFGLSRKTLEEAVRPEMREELEAKKTEWFAWDKWSGREPRLFKLEFEGKRGIALCSKCYFMEKEDGKTKVSSKGVSKRQN